MDHRLLGDDAREPPDVPKDAFDAEDSGDRGMEMDGFEDLAGDGTGEINFDDAEPRTASTPSVTAPASAAEPVTPRQTVGPVSHRQEGSAADVRLTRGVGSWLAAALYRRSLDGRR